MKKFYNAKSLWLFSNLLLFVLLSNLSVAQIFAPEGLNMPGDWNGWTNPPATNSPFGSEFQVSGGGVKKISSGQTRWQTTFTGVTGGGFKFTSGGGNPWGNEWGGTSISMNALQSYPRPATGNNSITCNASKYYTMVWEDVGYTSSTRAIFMETTNAPVTFGSITQSPLAAAVTPSTPVIVTVNTSAAPSPEEIVRIRWSTDNFITSTLQTVTMGGTSGTGTIPAQVDGSIVQYYAFTSTVASITADYDLQTINRSGNNTYTSSDGLVSVKFQVDMQNEVVSVNGVHVAGTFNGFSTTANKLDQVGSTSIYEKVISIPQNASLQYKYLNGNTGGNYENVPGGCATSGNRTFSVGTANVDIPTHCYAQCGACVAKVAVKFQVNMTGLTVSGNGVRIAGDFGSAYPTWDPGAAAGTMSETTPGSKIYEITRMLVPGQVVPYKFINGNAWGSDEGVPGACNVSGNRQFIVPGSATTVPLNCFGTCSSCVNVTFQVDMTGQTISPNGIHVAGQFQGWNPGSTALSYSGTGGIYTVSLNLDPNTGSEYKFINGNFWSGVNNSPENVPGICNTSGNRSFTVGASNKVLPVVCFERCIGCSSTSEWRGVSSNFNDGNNWTAGVPPTSCNFNIRIKETGVQPVIGGGTFSASSVVLNSGATLTVNSGATFNICGGLQGTNCNLTGAGTVNLNGTALQTIGGIVNVSNLRVENSSGVNLSPGTIVRVSGSLKLQNGFLNTTGGSFILAATPISEARILKVESGSGITGNVSYQKYLAGINSTPNGGWYFLSSPVGGFPLNGFDQGGNNLHPATFLPTNPDPASVYLYSQTAAGSFDEFGWAKSNNPSQVLTSGSGARVWARKVTSNGIMQFTGAPFSGSLSLPITFCSSGCSNLASAATNGWNLVANPYPCPVDWNAATGWSKSGIASNAIRIWNAASGNYSSYDGTVSLNGGSQNIAAGQAFFVEATSGAASLSINEDAKANVYTSGLRTNVAPVDGIRIRVNNGGLIDEAWVDFSTERLNTAVSKLLNPGVNVSIGEGKGFCIAGLNTVSSNGVIPVGLKNNSNSFSFEFEKEGDFWTNNQIFLKDNMNGTLQEINQANQTFSFVSTGFDSDRFSLLVTQGVLSNRELNKKSLILVWPNPVKNFLSVDKSHLNEAFVIMDITGKKILSSKIEEGQSTINVENLPLGSYIIRFSNTGETARFNKN